VSLRLLHYFFNSLQNFTYSYSMKEERM
jgi:hypothetical protein